jgi:hypothetical protein
MQGFNIDDQKDPEYRKFFIRDLKCDDAIEDIKDITKILRSSWFERVWVIQELVGSLKTSFFWNAGALVGYLEFKFAIAALRQHYIAFNTSAFQNEQMDNMAEYIALCNFHEAVVNFVQMADIREQILYHKIEMRLPLILHIYRNYQSSDPRDRVYAGLGLTDDDSLVQVDYSQSELDLSISTTKAWLNKKQNLEILGLCYIPLIPDIPSWALDITVTNMYYPLTSINLPNGNPRFSAGGKGICPITFEIENTLVLSSIYFGSIVFIPKERNYSKVIDLGINPDVFGLLNSEDKQFFKKPDFSPPIPKLEKAWLDEWQTYEIEHGSLLDELKLYPRTQEDVSKAFADTIRPAKIDGGGRLNETTDSAWIQDSKDIALKKHYLIWLNGRTFATTASKNFCLVREDAEIGDIIVVPQGAECPILLRLHPKGHYSFVGDCYVHGIMDGEVWENADQLVEEFRIR